MNLNQIGLLFFIVHAFLEGFLQVLEAKIINKPCYYDFECNKGLRCNKFCEKFLPSNAKRKYEKSKNRIDKCPPNWYDYNESCFFISKYRKKWIEAREDCLLKGGELLVIDSDLILDFSIDFFTKFKLTNIYFVGAKANGLPSNWQWLNGKIIPSSGYSWSENGKPSNNGGTNLKIAEGCATLNIYGLNDTKCDLEEFFICSNIVRQEKQSLIKIKFHKRLKKCRYDYHCLKGLICTKNMTCGCPDGFRLTSNFDKCLDMGAMNTSRYIGSSFHLDFFISKYDSTWLAALANSKKYQYNLMMFENSVQLIKFIDFTIKNNLAGPYWIGAFSLNNVASWIDSSQFPDGPWVSLPNINAKNIINSDIVCFALENYKIVTESCTKNYKALYVKGIKRNETQIELLLTELSTTIATVTPTVSSEFAIINPPGCGIRIKEVREQIAGRIVNGQKADSEDWGWQTLIEYRGIFICGGSIINSEWVVTAAHCLTIQNLKPTDITIKFGVYDQLNPQEYSISRIASSFIIHPDLNLDNFNNDIALIKLNSPLLFTDQILPVCIPDYFEDFSGNKSWTTGWGVLLEEDQTPSRYLMEVDLSILSDEECEKKYHDSYNVLLNTSNILCGRNSFKGPCFGDSGGPLVVKSKNKWVLAGITSWDIKCGHGAVFTRVTSYIDWIIETIKNHVVYPTSSFSSTTEAMLIDSSINNQECGLRPVKHNLIRQIVGGNRAIVKDWGWQVAINHKKYGFFCGGSILNSLWIITAAHCAEDIPRMILLGFGIHDREAVEPWSTSRNVVKVIVHPDYNPVNFDNDIALMKLDSPLTFTDNILPVCIPNESINFEKKISWATGWGTLKWQGDTSRYLMEVGLPILTNETCQQKYEGIDTTRVLCAGNTGENKDSCQGDSGGPLVVRNKKKWFLAGITSWGIGCGNGGVYTRTSFFLNWIKEIIKNN